ncbi:MAG: hypothetical protein AAGU77_08045 [Bacillota bacterium]
MILELQLLQQQAEDAYMTGYSRGKQSSLQMQQALPDASEQASYILPLNDEEPVAAPSAQDDPGHEAQALFSEAYYSKTQAAAGSSRQPLPFGRPKQQLPPPAIASEYSRHPIAE